MAGTSFKVFRFKSNTSFIRMSLIQHSTAEIPWAMTVASATPGTPILKPPTNHRSRPTFRAALTSRNSSAVKESPMPRRMPDSIL